MAIADFHMHGRDWGEADKETLQRLMELAEASSIDAVGLQVNTKPALIDPGACLSYVEKAQQYTSRVKVYALIGLTTDRGQVREALQVVGETNGICAAKVFLEPSTNELTVDQEADQIMIAETAADLNYRDVLVSHLGNIKHNRDSEYDPGNPKSWSTICRPEVSETSKFDQWVYWLESFMFEGRLHIPHVSTCYVVDRAVSYEGPFTITTGITPAHLLFTDKMFEGVDGPEFKSNPPLRSAETQAGLWQRYVDGYIDLIESDHAPHLKKEDQHPSGMAQGLGWAYVYDMLSKNPEVTAERLRQTTFDNPVKLYGLEDEIERTEFNPDWERLKKIVASYPFDPFQSLKSA